MKVLLIEPLKVIWEMMRPCVPVPLGLAQLAGVLEEQEIDVKIVDCTALNMGRQALAEAMETEEEFNKQLEDIVAKNGQGPEGIESPAKTFDGKLKGKAKSQLHRR